MSDMAEAFGIFGEVVTTEVRIRDTYEDEVHKVSWGLVSFSDDAAVKKAVADSASIGRPGWVVKVRQNPVHSGGRSSTAEKCSYTNAGRRSSTSGSERLAVDATIVRLNA